MSGNVPIFVALIAFSGCSMTGCEGVREGPEVEYEAGFFVNPHSSVGVQRPEHAFLPARPPEVHCPNYPIRYSFDPDMESTVRTELDLMVAAHHTNWFHVRFHESYQTIKNAEVKMALEDCGRYNSVEMTIRSLIVDWPGVFLVDAGEWTFREPEQAGLMCADLVEGERTVFWLKRQRIGELFFLPRSGGEIGFQLGRENGRVYLYRIIGSYLPGATPELNDAKDEVYACGTVNRLALEDTIKSAQVSYVYFMDGSCTIEGQDVYRFQENDVLTWDSEGWSPAGAEDVFFHRWRRATIQIHPDNMTEELNRSSAACGFEVIIDVVAGGIVTLAEDWSTCIIC